MKNHIRLILIGVSVIIAGIINGQMDTLTFRFAESRYAKMENQVYWNPDISWKNKYKNYDPEQGPKFFLSTTALVFLTDGWHLLQFFQLLFFGLAILIGIDYRYKLLGWTAILIVFVVKGLYGLGHGLSFRKKKSLIFIIELLWTWNLKTY